MVQGSADKVAVFNYSWDGTTTSAATSTEYEASCELVGGVDFYGNDIYNERAKSITQCIDGCMAHPLCSHFTFVYGRCFYKTSNAGSRQHETGISGICTNSSKLQEACVIEEGVDYYGKDLYDVAAANINLCEIQCREEPACNFFTYVFGRCYYKLSDSGRMKSSNAISAICLKPDKDEAPCVFESGVDYYGDDLLQIPESKSIDCVQHCLSNPECFYFTYVYGNCYLKHAAGRVRRRNPTALSAVCIEMNSGGNISSTNGSGSCVIEYKVDYFGDDIVDQKANTVEECVEQCTEMEACTHFSFVYGKCFFKHGPGTRRDILTAISGTCQ